MSCSHGWHDYRPCGHVLYGSDWGYPDWIEDIDRIDRRRVRGPNRRGAGMAAEDLEARLGDLQRMVREIERDLEDLRRPQEDAAR